MNNMTLMNMIWQGFNIELPLYPWFSESIKQVYNRNIFREMVNTQTTRGQFTEMLSNFANLRNKYIGYELANSCFYLVRENKKFKFGIYSTGEFSLWDDNDKSLGNFNLGKNYKDELPSAEFIKWIEEVTSDYCKGTIRCSDCGSKLVTSEIAGRYFSGVYCKECCENKWRKIESQETYD